jgi:hypothetical protein
MPVPTNTSATTAIEIAELPYSGAQQADFEGTTYDLWYRWTAPECVELIGIAVYGDASVYTPRVQVYIGPAASPVLHYGDSGNNQPAQIPVDAGTEYFIKFRTNVGNPAPANLTFAVYVGPNESAAAGAIVVSDDTPGYPAMVVDASTGLVLRSARIPAGEEGDSLPSGVMLIADEYDTDTYKLYSSQFVELGSVPFLADNYAGVRAVPGANAFVIADYGRSGAIHQPTVGTVSAAGALGATTWTLSRATDRALTAIGANNALTVLYYVDYEIGAPTVPDSTLRRWDLVNDVGLSDLVAPVADYHIYDILTLEDDSIVVSYFRKYVYPWALVVRRYSAAGALLNTYDLGTDHKQLAPRLGYSSTAGAFWVYVHPFGVDTVELLHLRASDGLTLATLTVPSASTGGYEPPVTSADPVPFGISPSCPIFPLRQQFYACGESPEPEPESPECVLLTPLTCWAPGTTPLGCGPRTKSALGCWSGSSPADRQVGLLRGTAE